jgi:hypothetical protein
MYCHVCNINIVTLKETTWENSEAPFSRVGKTRKEGMGYKHKSCT